MHKLYEDDLNRTLEGYGYSTDRIRFYIHSFSDLKRVAEGIAKADDIYKAARTGESYSRKVYEKVAEYESIHWIQKRIS